MATQRFQMQLSGHEFSVFDEEGSLTPHFVHRELLAQEPFKLVNPKMIVDIGANVGIWSFWMSKLYPEAKFMALEPVSRNAEHLMMGISYGEFTNVKGFQVAVSNKREVITLGLDPTNSGGSSRHNSTTMGSAMANALPLDEVLAESGPADLVKIDIEGDEFTLFEGFKSWDKIGAMVMELHPWLITHNEPSQFKLVEDFIEYVQTSMRGKPVEIQSSNEKFARKP